jgi:hypothetical protein
MPLDWRLLGTGIIFVLFYEWIVLYGAIGRTKRGKSKL